MSEIKKPSKNVKIMRVINYIAITVFVLGILYKLIDTFILK